MSPKVTTLRTVPELDAEVIILQITEYGSTNIDALNTLGEDLRRLAKQGEATSVVLDVTAVRYAGAGWVGVIAEFVAACRCAGRRVLLCGDRTGLLIRARLERVAPVFTTASAALQHCPKPAYAWPSRFALPLPLLTPVRDDKLAFRAD